MEQTKKHTNSEKAQKGVKLLSILDKLRVNANEDCKNHSEDNEIQSDADLSATVTDAAADAANCAEESFARISSVSIEGSLVEGSLVELNNEAVDADMVTVVPLTDQGHVDDAAFYSDVAMADEQPLAQGSPRHLQNAAEAAEDAGAAEAAGAAGAAEADATSTSLPSHVRCTGCGKKLNTHKALQHPVLNVLVCKACSKFYNSSSFSRDKFGIEEYCKWCGDGGNLICCDFCEKVFCQRCVKRNMGEEFLKILLDADQLKWKCFACDPSQIAHFTCECKAIIKLLKKIKMGRYAFENNKTHLGGPSQLERKDRLINITQTLGDSGVALREAKIEIDPDIASLVQEDVNDIRVVEPVVTRTKNKKGLEKVSTDSKSSKHPTKSSSGSSEIESVDNQLCIVNHTTEEVSDKVMDQREDGNDSDELLLLEQKFELKNCQVLLERIVVTGDGLSASRKDGCEEVCPDAVVAESSGNTESSKQRDAAEETALTICLSEEGGEARTKEDDRSPASVLELIGDSSTTRSAAPEATERVQFSIVDDESESDVSDFKPVSEDTDEREEEDNSEENQIGELEDDDLLKMGEEETGQNNDDLSDEASGRGSSESDFDYQRVKNRSIRNGRKKPDDRKKSASEEVSDEEEMRDISSDASRKNKGEKRKRKSVSASKGTDSSNSDSDVAKRTKRRRRRRKTAHEQSSESDDSEEDGSEAKEEGGDSTGRRDKRRSRRKGKGKRDGKRQLRRKKILGSDSDESSDDKSKEKSKGRKNIRRILAEEELTEETRKARQLEEERRRRLLDRTQATYAEEETQRKDFTHGSFVLERDKETGTALVEVHHSLVPILKPHQTEGIQFLYDCLIESLEKYKKGCKGNGALLAHCMGLGKSLQIVTFLHTIANHPEFDLHKFLVVAPLNTVYNWETEFEKWLELDERMDVYVLSDAGHSMKQRVSMLRKWFAHGGIMIIGYDMYRNLTQFKRIRNRSYKKVIAETLLEPGPDIVVCDEGHILRNDLSAISQALCKIKTLRRVVLTGTPLQNNLTEYFVMVSFVKPNLLGTKKEFKNIFMNPIKNGQCANSTPADVKVMKQRCHVLHDTLSGCVQRKDYAVLEPFLTPKHEYTIFVRLGERQKKMYQFYLDNFVCGNLAEVRARGTGIFSDYQCLMKIWTHPWAVKHEAIRRLEREAQDEFKDFLDDSESESESSPDGESENNSRKPEWRSSDSDAESTRVTLPKDTASSADEEEEEEEVDNTMVNGNGENHQPQVSLAVRTRSSLRSRRDNTNVTVLNENSVSSKEDKSEVILEKAASTADDTSRSLPCDGDESNPADAGSDDEAAGNSTRSGARFRKPDMEMEPEIETKEWYDDFIDEGDDTNIELSGKLVLLLEILADAEIVGDKILVFSQSLVSLDLIERTLGGGTIGGNEMNWCKGVDYFRLDGSTPAKTRRRYSEIFNDVDNPTARLFLISTKAGSLGVNLVAANRVIVFDCSWNPSHDVQSVFRVYRFGQDKPVYVYRFVAHGTMEQKIYERQINKLALSGRVVDEQQISRHFTDEELRELYAFNMEEYKEGDDRPVPQLPADPLLAEVLQRQHPKWIVSYQEHDLLLENVEDEKLTEEERKQAWASYEEQKDQAKRELVFDAERIRLAQERMQMMQQTAQQYRDKQLQLQQQQRQQQQQHRLINLSQQQSEALRRILALQNANRSVGQGVVQARPVTSMSSEERFRNLQIVALAGTQNNRLASWNPVALANQLRPNMANARLGGPLQSLQRPQIIDLRGLNGQQVRGGNPSMHPRSSVNLSQENNVRLVNIPGAMPRSASFTAGALPFVPRRA